MSIFAHPHLSSRQRDFDGWWQQQGVWVEAPNARRGGHSGVQKIDGQDGLYYAKRQVGHVYRSWARPLGAPTILREAYAYQCFGKLGVQVPQVVFSGARKVDGQWQALLVTQELAGFVELNRWYQTDPSPARRQAMLTQLAQTLVTMHQGHWQHGCLYAKHIFIQTHVEAPKVALLDLEKCRKRLRIAKARHNDLHQLKRHKGLMPEADLALLLEMYKELETRTT